MFAHHGADVDTVSNMGGAALDFAESGLDMLREGGVPVEDPSTEDDYLTVLFFRLPLACIQRRRRPEIFVFGVYTGGIEIEPEERAAGRKNVEVFGAVQRGKASQTVQNHPILLRILQICARH